MDSIKGKVALVTGGAGGFGGAVCRLLAEAGAKLKGADAQAARVDLSREDSIKAMIAEIFAFFRLDILNNNAARLTPEIARRDPDIEPMATEDWGAAFCVNKRGTMIACREALHLMSPQGAGVIVNTASQAALIQMTRSIATSHGKRGIRRNAVLPGQTGTPAALGNLPGGLPAIVEEETLTPYLGAREDIARLVVLLASNEACYITGQAMAADGGNSVHIPGYARLSRFFGA